MGVPPETRHAARAGNCLNCWPMAICCAFLQAYLSCTPCNWPCGWWCLPCCCKPVWQSRPNGSRVYLPAVLLSFVAMGGMFSLERRGYQKKMLMGKIGLLGLVQLGFWAQIGSPQLLAMGLCLLVFFVGFNIMEASQPSLCSRLAPANARGTAMGIYNTLQSLGFFVGGAAGGWGVKTHGPAALFLACAGLVGAWWLLSWGLQVPAPKAASQN